MAIVQSQNVLQISAIATVHGIPHVNVWHMWNDETSSMSDADVAKDFANNWQDHILGRLHSGYKINSFEWFSMDPDDNNSGVIAPDTLKPTAGAIPGSPFPNSVCALVKKVTANRPRGRRDGRSFISGIPETPVDELGRWTVTERDAWNTALEAFRNGITDEAVAGGARYPVVLETTPASRAPGSTPVVIGSRKVSQIILDPVVSTQRDRLR